MGNKRIPDEVVTAMNLAKEAGWPVSNRNKIVHIVAPDGVNITIGYSPNDESMKVFRSNCRKYNLVGNGPARTRDEVDRIVAEAEQSGVAEAERLNAQRKAYEAKQKARQQQIEAARQKADAAIQQGMIQETMMPKIEADLFPTFDTKLLGTKDAAVFKLKNGLYYCIECLEKNIKATYKAPQGLAAHRSRWHQLYNESAPIAPTQEINRVPLPADVDTAFDMLRSAMAEALVGADPQDLASKEAELADLRSKLDAVTKQSDADRKDFDKRFLEAQVSFDKRLAELLVEAGHEADAKREAEVKAMMENFMGILIQIRQATETLAPIQAVGKIDTIVSETLSK